MQAPASRGPMMSPIPFVVVARPAIAPRSVAGMSLNRRPQASVITAPPPMATKKMIARYQACHSVARPPPSRPRP